MQVIDSWTSHPHLFVFPEISPTLRRAHARRDMDASQEDLEGRPLRIGIKGFGRIGRLLCRASRNAGITVVEINDPVLGAKYASFLLTHENARSKHRLRYIPSSASAIWAALLVLVIKALDSWTLGFADAWRFLPCSRNLLPLMSLDFHMIGCVLSLIHISEPTRPY